MSQTTTQPDRGTSQDFGRTQLLIRLRASQDCAFERQYHRKIRGRLAQCLDGTNYDERDSDASPFAFSDPMPYQSTYDAGDEVHLLVSSRRVGALKSIVAGLSNDPRLTAGSMVFDVRAATPVPLDVGPPGESGTITTSSGALVTIDTGEEGEYDSGTYWSNRNHSEPDFQRSLDQSVARQCRYEHGLEPLPDDERLFDEHHHRKTFAVDVEVTPKNHLTVIASKFDFGFEVRDEHHRRVLNATIAAGIGSKRSYGFGCLQVECQSHDPTGDVDRTPPEVRADG
jgi:CRISPR-associated endoribonuclease Cas6